MYNTVLSVFLWVRDKNRLSSREDNVLPDFFFFFQSFASLRDVMMRYTVPREEKLFGPLQVTWIEDRRIFIWPDDKDKILQGFSQKLVPVS